MQQESTLTDLESRSIYIIREALWKYRDRMALLWSMGKDSTALLHLVRKAFFGHVPFPVVHIDTARKFPEIYRFRDTYAKKWKLNLLIERNEEAVKAGMSPEKGRFDCCMELKTNALKSALERHGFKAILLGIRRDEHAIRAKERYFSIRDSDFAWNYRNPSMEMWAEYYRTSDDENQHFRVHPLLHWQEADVWRYVKREKLPVVDLYFAKKGKRYRSIGCECCCQAVDSAAATVDKVIGELEETTVAERSGRCQDKEQEYMMQKLRCLGYM